MKTAYLYFDESGDFNFSSTGSKHFALTCMAVTNPTKLPQALLPIRYDTLSKDIKRASKHKDYYSFHATDDSVETRRRIFNAISVASEDFDDANFQVLSVIVRKNKVNPSG